MAEMHILRKMWVTRKDDVRNEYMGRNLGITATEKKKKNIASDGLNNVYKRTENASVRWTGRLLVESTGKGEKPFKTLCGAVRKDMS